MRKATKIVEDALNAGWKFDGYLSETFDWDSPSTSEGKPDPTLERGYEYLSINLSFKRKIKEGRP